MQRILVVEDDFDIQELLQNFLQEAGYEVAVANDGVEALSLFAGERYDLLAYQFTDTVTVNFGEHNVQHNQVISFSRK